MTAQTAQTICQVLIVVAGLVATLAGYGSFHFKGLADKERQAKSDNEQSELHSRIEKLQNTYEANTTLLFSALKIKQEEWVELKTETVPPTTAYLLLLFRSDKGRIDGKVRVKGSKNIAVFSTTANDTVPLAIQNVWSASTKKYNWPVTLELAVTEKTQSDAALSILTQGWIDDLGQEPH
jgi:hypothetical protein